MTAAERITPVALAQSSGLDIDEVLVRLWDAEIDVNGPSDMIPGAQLQSARRAVGVPDPRRPVACFVLFASNAKVMRISQNDMMTRISIW